MGTRCLTVVKDENGAEIVVLYRQFDGYLDGHGKELAEFLSNMAIVNGMNGSEPEKFANGMGCLAAQVISHFKKKPGGFYLYPAGTKDLWEDYRYEVTGKEGDNEPTIKVDDYEGKASGFDAWLKSQYEDEE